MTKRYLTLLSTRETPILVGPCLAEQEIIDLASRAGLHPSPDDVNSVIHQLNRQGVSLEIYDADRDALLFLERTETLGHRPEDRFVSLVKAEVLLARHVRFFKEHPDHADRKHHQAKTPAD